jgi:mannan endo-1,4-beta-mannosidase
LTPSLPNPAPKKVGAKPVDPNATKEAKALLTKLSENYGKQTFSGQYDWTETNQIKAIAGVTPAILGADLMDYSPSRIARGADPKKTTERVIDAAKRGQIVTLSWHWNAPKDLIDKEYTAPNGEKINGLWYKGFYTNATTFDVEKALKNPTSEDYKLLIRDIDVIAVELKKLQKAGVPVLWRPLHECDGRWFWWGAKGPEPLKQLWRIMFRRLTDRHNLHNLIWVFTGLDPAWYPGDNYVDIIGIDAYPGDSTDPLTPTWESQLKRFDGKKMLAISEFGGIPDVAKMRRFGVYWAYFVTWSGTASRYMSTPDELKRLYRDKSVSNLEDSISSPGKSGR